MKITVSFKDPDAVYEAVDEAVRKEVKAIKDIDEYEREGLIEKRSEQVRKKLSKWFEFGEYVEVEIDTDADTATVLRAK